MQDLESASITFLRNIFSGNVDRVNDLLWPLLVVIAITLVVCWTAVSRPLLRYVAVFSGIALFLIGLSYSGAGPESVRLMQSVRLLNLTPLVVGVIAAIAVDAALRVRPSLDARGLAAPALAIAAAGALFVPMFRFATDRSYAPAWSGPDALGSWLQTHDFGEPGRVWMDGRETTWYTFQDAGELRSARSGFVQGDWSLLARPLQEGVLVGDPGWQTTEDYMKSMSISYLYVADDAAFGRELQQGGALAGRYREVLHVDGYPSETLYAVPWRPVDAFIAPAGSLPALSFPRGGYETPARRATRDRLTHQYAQLVYSSQSTPANVVYPSATTMRVTLPRLPLGQRLVIAENWDRSWRAEASGRSLPVRRYGPNYIEVDVSRLSGDVVIDLRHDMSWDWKLGIALTLLSLPVAGGLTLLAYRQQTKM
jgi:hypothetical protein